MAHYTKTPKHKQHLHPFVTIGVGILLLGTGFVLWSRINKFSDDRKVDIVAGTFPKKVLSDPGNKQVISEVKASGATLTNDEAASITAVVNKKHALPVDYAPNLTAIRGGQLRAEASSALEELFTAAEKAELHPKIVSSYRSYATQITTYNNYVSQYGKDKADTFSARPGHSEHQTGLAVDVGNSDGSCELDICFGMTDFGTWIGVEAYRFGFIVRYPDGKESATGYQYEPWHIRYIGKDTAIQVYDSGKTLDEYFGVDAGDYTN